MNALPQEFDGNRDQKGYKFKVIDRHGQVCLLKKWNPNHIHGQEFYEVVILRTVPEKSWPDGRVTIAHEAMPSPEEWGVYGWSPWDLQAARERFNRTIYAQTKT